MEDWELGLIVGCGVLAGFLIGVVIFLMIKQRRNHNNGENKPLLGEKSKFTKHNGINNGHHLQQHHHSSSQQHHDDDQDANYMNETFLDGPSLKRVIAWADDVESYRITDDLEPLYPSRRQQAAISSLSSNNNGSQSQQQGLLGDDADYDIGKTPDPPGLDSMMSGPQTPQVTSAW